MMNDILYCCTMTDRSELPDVTPELLSAFWNDISSWKDEETKVTRHTLYFQDEAACREAMKQLEEKAEEFASYGCILEDFTYATLKREDWAEVWKLHFKPIVISDRLAFAPSWEKFETKPGQLLITLDPGMSFGTGQHATTKFCLGSLDKFILQLKAEGKDQISMLDAGSGSGILAIAAERLGCTRVDAFDIDPDTIPVAYENAEKNGIDEDAIVFQAASLTDYNSTVTYDIVAANILSSALMAGRDKLLSFCHKGTYLVLAGILDAEYETVKGVFEASGRCRELFSSQEKEWRGGAFEII
ncbi:MAG: 50S ribosomal protein L11 methyltransferase [Lentisphaeria bacterium]|nr:50S ribosomal protein L11 methyltransferase [Lentisphaeria bacterium]